MTPLPQKWRLPAQRPRAATRERPRKNAPQSIQLIRDVTAAITIAAAGGLRRAFYC